MTAQLIPATVTVPAGTAKATPGTFAVGFNTFIVDFIRWRVPPGPLGNLGWYLAVNNDQVVPHGRGVYVVANDEVGEWRLDGLPDSGAWNLVGYNTGNFDHSVYLWFGVTPVQLAGPPATVAPAPLVGLSGAVVAPSGLVVPATVSDVSTVPG